MSNNNTNRVVEFAQESGKTIAGAIAGGALGLAASWYGRFQAQAAVEVRPGLADVGFIKALVTNHGMDWLFYHEPNEATVALVVIFGLIGAVVGAYK